MTALSPRRPRPVLHPRTSLSVVAGRGAAVVSRRFGRGGTSLPGLIGLYIAPRLTFDLARQLGGGAILVAGTNGKTTTATLLAAALSSSGHCILHNQEGSNLLRGIATTLVKQTDLAGRLRNARGLTGVFEVDEAALPQVIQQVQPRTVVISNLFRDQLDRYGEVAITAARWRTAIRALPGSASLILNADDPLVATLGDTMLGRVLYFGLQSWPRQHDARHAPAASADSLYCPHCHAPLTFSALAFAHLGHYQCGSCDFRRPRPDLVVDIEAASSEGSVALVSYGGEVQTLRLALPGRYNVYNAAAALAAAVHAGAPLAGAVHAVATTRGAFGRAETIQVRGRQVRLFLIKNPTGADEVLRVVAEADHQATLLFLLNDQAADGRDISWIWDVEFELLTGWTGPMLCGGTRAEDMAVRLKYADLGAITHFVPSDIPRAMATAIQTTANAGTMYVLATYTAMLTARGALAREGHIAQYWQTVH